MSADLKGLDAVLDAVDFLGACDLLDELEPGMTPAAVAGAEAIIRTRFPEDAKTLMIENALAELTELRLVEKVEGAE